MLSYRGEELAMQVLRNQLDPDRPGNPWLPFINDMLSKGPATVNLYPEMLELSEDLKALDEEQCNSLRPEILQTLRKAFDRRKQFVQDMRSGLLKSLDAQLLPE